MYDPMKCPETPVPRYDLLWLWVQKYNPIEGLPSLSLSISPRTGSREP